jgi:hypothetical protein
MPAYPFNPSLFFWNPPHPYSPGSFRPQGKMQAHGDISLTRNPRGWGSKDTLAARIIVGFSVRSTPTYSLDDLVELVAHVRQRQAGNPSASFVAQRGIYQHHDGETVTEDGAQVFIINMQKLTDEEFTAQMVELAETICRDMEQEEVIVEIQKNGISQETIGVIP